MHPMMIFEWSEYFLEISKISFDPAVPEFESREEWEAAAKFAYDKWMQNPANLNALVAAGTQMWYTILLVEERKYNPFRQCSDSNTELPCTDGFMVWLMEITRYGFDHFSESTSFNAFFGYMIKVMPYLFEDYQGDYVGWYYKGAGMMKKAYQLAPQDLLAKAMYYEAIEDDMEYRNVCKQIWANLTPEEWGNSLVQQYFFRILNGDHFYPNAYE